MVLSSVVRPQPIVALLLSFTLLSVVPFGGAESHDTPEPYFVEYSMEGRIGCAVSWAILESRDRCSTEYTKTEFEVPLDPYLTTFVYTLESPDRLLSTDSLHTYFVRPAEAFGEVRGPTPHHMVRHFDEDNNWVSWNNPPDLMFVVRPDSQTDLPRVVYNQPFTVCIGLFYHGAEVPEDYHPCP